MNRRTLFALIACLLCGRTARAADDPLALIPPKAIATVQINGVQRVQDRLERLLKAAVPDRVDEASKAVRDAIADALAGRDTKALRPDGRVLIAIADLEKLPDSATLTFLFPVTSADDFRTHFLTADERKSLKKDGDLETLQWEDRKEPFYLVQVKDYVAVTSDKETATLYARGEVGGVAKQLSADTARTFLDADVGLFVNVREAKAKYGDQLKRVKALADLFLKGDAVQGVSRAQFDQLKAAIAGVSQVVEHGTAAVLAIEFRPDGLGLRGLAQFADRTATAEALAKYKPTPLPEIGTLPAGLMAYTASTLNPNGNGGRESFAVEDASPAARDAIAGLQKQATGYDRGLTLSAAQAGRAAIEVTASRDAGKIVDARLGMLKAMTKDGSFGGTPLKLPPDVRERAESIGGFTLHRARFIFDFDRAVADLPPDQRETARAAARKVVGGDEVSVWLGTDGKSVLQLTAPEWPPARTLAESYLNRVAPLENDEAYQFTRKQLPAEATILVVLDAAQTARSVFDAIKDPSAAPKPDPKAGGKRAYVGIAVVLRPGHGGFDLFLPAAAADPVRRIVEPLLDEKK